ncbi:MAG: hypothetical protein V4507_02250 [Verrucomicrobiota bacterium]
MKNTLPLLLITILIGVAMPTQGSVIAVNGSADNIAPTKTDTPADVPNGQLEAWTNDLSFSFPPITGSFAGSNDSFLLSFSAPTGKEIQITTDTQAEDLTMSLNLQFTYTGTTSFDAGTVSLSDLTFYSGGNALSGLGISISGSSVTVGGGNLLLTLDLNLTNRFSFQNMAFNFELANTTAGTIPTFNFSSANSSIEFATNVNPNSSLPVFDGNIVSLSAAVPEPSSMALGLGLFLILGIAINRKRTSQLH